MMKWRVSLLLAVTLGIAGCTSQSTSPASRGTAVVRKTHSTPTTGTRQARPTTPSSVTTQSTRSSQTTVAPPTSVSQASATPGHPGCMNGTVTVTAEPGNPVPVCVSVGTTLVLTGGEGMSMGTWPGPPTISDLQVVVLVSSTSSGTTLTATLRAIGTGTASVEAPFVAGPDVCNPTPCTPVPGAPLGWEITVVR